MNEKLTTYFLKVLSELIFRLIRTVCFVNTLMNKIVISFLKESSIRSMKETDRCESSNKNKKWTNVKHLFVVWTLFSPLYPRMNSVSLTWMPLVI